MPDDVRQFDHWFEQTPGFCSAGIEVLRSWRDLGFYVWWEYYPNNLLNARVAWHFRGRPGDYNILFDQVHSRVPWYEEPLHGLDHHWRRTNRLLSNPLEAQFGS